MNQPFCVAAPARWLTGCNAPSNEGEHGASALAVCCAAARPEVQTRRTGSLRRRGSPFSGNVQGFQGSRKGWKEGEAAGRDGPQEQG